MRLCTELRSALRAFALRSTELNENENAFERITAQQLIELPVLRIGMGAQLCAELRERD